MAETQTYKLLCPKCSTPLTTSETPDDSAKNGEYGSIQYIINSYQGYCLDTCECGSYNVMEVDETTGIISVVSTSAKDMMKGKAEKAAKLNFQAWKKITPPSRLNCIICNNNVKNTDDGFATYCGSFCAEHHKVHLEECTVCTKEIAKAA